MADDVWMIEQSITYEFHGTLEEAEKARDELVTYMADRVDVHCGETDCCGPLPDGPYSMLHIGSSTLESPEDYEARIEAELAIEDRKE